MRGKGAPGAIVGRRSAAEDRSSTERVFDVWHDEAAAAAEAPQLSVTSLILGFRSWASGRSYR